ncbi:phage holin family protein [Hydrotalea sandarakina]|jgi:putative membrane protein|uniref:Putative membrane protein n=1 Tax=Hydrotalea sandarakina TaxID=1004304 RepID=A0A2W7S4V8_9BACT|nr:phage holin family protein [Hydrotalea sandarakina]PZX62297.1 putative membrane protein [Hydrotalea sandarakina]
MISFLSKVLFTSVAVLVATYILSGVHVNSTATAILVAVVLGLLNTFVKPILIILTIPFTILTLGLFLLVINVLIIKWTSELVPGFRVDGWWSALFFSIIVSLVSSFIEGLVRNNEA